ncbi:MAG: PP2C family protein-serine/threonine phosphatase, partial [Candidatus Margulisiibacteriota bacterium]
MKTGKIGRFLFGIGYYRNSVMGPAQLGVTRNWFGKGKVVGVWGGGVSRAAEDRQLALLRDPNARTSAKKTILEGIISGKVTFNYVTIDEVSKVLKEIEANNEISNLVKEALKKLPPFSQLPEPNLEDFVNIVSEMIGGGEEGELSSFGPKIAGISYKGGRKNNEDALFIGKDGKILLFVADGMGGHNDGEKASKIAAEKISDIFDVENFNLSDAYKAIHQALMEEKNNNRLDPYAGTTAVSALIDPSQNLLIVANVGDSRAYLIRKGDLYQLTRDDNFCQESFFQEKGINNLPLNPELTEDYYTRSINAKEGGINPLMSVLGRKEERLRYPIPPFENNFELQEGDIILLMSDGVHDYLPLATFKKIVGGFANMSALEIARKIKESIESPGDNITIAVYKHEKEEVMEVSDSMIQSIEASTQVGIPSQLVETEREIDALRKRINDLETALSILEAEKANLQVLVQQSPLDSSREALNAAASKLIEKYQQLANQKSAIESELVEKNNTLVRRRTLLSRLRQIDDAQRKPYQQLL